MLEHKGKVVDSFELQAKRVEDRKEKKITKGKILPLNVWIYTSTIGWNLLMYEYVGDDELISRCVFDELVTREWKSLLEKGTYKLILGWTCNIWFKV